LIVLQFVSLIVEQEYDDIFIMPRHYRRNFDYQ